MAQNQFDVSCGSSGSYINPVILHLLAGFVAAVCFFVGGGGVTPASMFMVAERKEQLIVSSSIGNS